MVIDGSSFYTKFYCLNAIVLHDYEDHVEVLISFNVATLLHVYHAENDDQL